MGRGLNSALGAIGELEKLLDAKKAEVQRTRSEELEALRRAAEAQKEERERQFRPRLGRDGQPLAVRVFGPVGDRDCRSGQTAVSC